MSNAGKNSKSVLDRNISHITQTKTTRKHEHQNESFKKIEKERKNKENYKQNLLHNECFNKSHLE